MITCHTEKYKSSKTSYGDYANRIRIAQEELAQQIKTNNITIYSIDLYPASNLIVFNNISNVPIMKGRSVGMTTFITIQALSILRPQVWFLHFLYKTMPKYKDSIKFYIKHSHDVKERFKYNGINEELKTFVMAATLS